MIEEAPWQQALRYATRANSYPFYAELRKTPVARQPDGSYVESSVQFWPTRSALDDSKIAGTTIPKGAPIFLLYGSANRDPQRFENPDEIDFERPNNEHLGFSQGIHYCFGASLARLEVQIAVGEFVRRVENPRLVVDPPPYRRNQIFRGPRHLLVVIDGCVTDAGLPTRRMGETGGAARGAGAGARSRRSPGEDWRRGRLPL